MSKVKETSVVNQKKKIEVWLYIKLIFQQKDPLKMKNCEFMRRHIFRFDGIYIFDNRRERKWDEEKTTPNWHAEILSLANSQKYAAPF